MDLKCYPLMSTSTKRRMCRRFRFTRNKRKRKYHYNPGGLLISYLSDELGMSKSSVREQIAKERLYLLKDLYGDTITKADI
jgi:hypothetical protein